MKLEDVMKLRPALGADSATLAAAIATAEAALAEQRRRLAEARIAGANVLAPDKEIAAADRMVGDAELTAARLEALLPAIHDDHSAALAREKRAELLARFETHQASVERLRHWQEELYPRIAEMIGQGLRIQDDITRERSELLAAIHVAYGMSEHMRDAGPLGVQLAPLGELLPRTVFSTWSF